jgi:ATP-dependent Clp protease protease subunit
MGLVPMVVEQTPRGERAFDIFLAPAQGAASSSCRPSSRTSWPNLVIAQMLYLEADDPDKDINLYINSPGGSVTAGMAIYDTMQYVKPADLHHLHGPGRVDGRALLLCAGARGKRFALPHARIMIHQPLGGVQGQATDIDIQARKSSACARSSTASSCTPLSDFLTILSPPIVYFNHTSYQTKATEL